MNIKKPTNEILDSMNLDSITKYFKFFPEVENGDKNYLVQKSGDQHYRLLSWFSTQFNDCEISEIGTCDGMGLLSLCFNSRNKVFSYDIMDYQRKHDVPPNGTRVLCDKDFNFFERVIKSKIIFYDANHNGQDELFFLKKLIELNYSGIIIYDDINLTENMINFWNEAKKIINVEDWTDVGHYEGTGVIFINM
jgi:hypothetical protein